MDPKLTIITNINHLRNCNMSFIHFSFVTKRGNWRFPSKKFGFQMQPYLLMFLCLLVMF